MTAQRTSDTGSASVTAGIYVYGIVRAEVPVPDDLPTVGGTDLRLVRSGPLAALVSEVDLDRPLGLRDDLLAHEGVLDAVAADSTVLPLRFGGVVQDLAAVRNELLAGNQDDFESILAELDGLVEFTLHGSYLDQIHLREIVGDDPEIRGLREELQGVPEDSGHAARVRLGELVSAAVGRKRELTVGAAVAALSPHSAATSVREVSGQDDALSVALLVDRDRIEDFQRAVDELGEDFAGRVRLRLLGPLAPYDFLPED